MREAVAGIAPHVRPGNLVILESTSPVGTTETLVAGGLRACGIDVPGRVHVAHCPERVLPGRILVELVQNDRIVGGVDEASTTAAAAFYREFVSGEVLETTAATSFGLAQAFVVAGSDAVIAPVRPVRDASVAALATAASSALARPDATVSGALLEAIKIAGAQVPPQDRWAFRLVRP